MKRQQLIWLISVFCCIQFATSDTLDKDDAFCTINTNSGQIRGKQNRTLFENMAYYSFRGIPFAQPPISNLRFKAPQKIEPWTETLDAFEFGNDCIQPNRTSMEFHGSEDCLYLNVFVPKCPAKQEDAKLPVIFYIFGGQFAFGTSSTYGPDFLLETKDVIIVTFNYRVGPFGFMKLKHMPEYSGNMGLKDQLVALQWVNKNIEYFGGDKNQLTLFGHSSGSSSINLLTILPQANHLFQKAILMSGSALNPFLPRHHDHYTIMSNLAESLHYPVTSQSELNEFLHEIDGKTLYQKTYQDDYVPGLGRKYFDRVWTVCIEEKTAIDPILTEQPFNILTSPEYRSQIDTLYSASPWEMVVTKEEKEPELLKNFDEKFEIELALKIAHLNWKMNSSREIMNKIREFYFGDKHVNGETITEMNKLMTDAKFLYPINLNARIQAKSSTGRTIVAEFSATNDWSYSERLAKKDNYTARYPTHSDQLFYLFLFTDYPETISQHDYQILDKNSLPGQIIKNLTNFYMNFAKFGNPIPHIKPIDFKDSTSNQYNYYNITTKGVFIESNPYRERMNFWDNLFNEFKYVWNITFNFNF